MSRYTTPRVVIAIPTIAERAELCAATARSWQERTCQPLEAITSLAPGGWAAGLNDVWAQVRDPAPAVFVCASDDMVPADDNWLPPLLDVMSRGAYPAPAVVDPRFTNYGGHLEPVPDGTPSDMSSFPVLHGQWGDSVFPLPDDLHYYADNLVAVKLALLGIPCVAVPSSRIQHLWAKEGRGAGAGDEDVRMLIDSRRYTRALEELGVDRKQLPEGQRGPIG